MRFVDAGTRMRGVLLLVVWTCGPIRGSSSSLSPWSPRPTAPSPHGDLMARVRGGGGRRGRPPLYEPLISDVGLSRLTRHDRENNKPHVGRPPGRPPAWQRAQSNNREDGKLRGDFRTHSWGESAVGAIGECTAEQVLWEKYFMELQEHFNRTRAGLPDNWRDSPVLFRKGNAPPVKGLPLREWVDNQRQLYRHGELDVKRQQMLQDTGLQLTLKGKLREVDWETMVGRLKSFYMLHGHCRVHEHEGEELLEQWVQVQQMKEMRGTLGNEKQTLLNSLGVSWKSSWLESWKQLCLLKQHNGKIRVITLKTSKRTLPLYIWLRNQRLMQMEGSLDKDREELLESLGCRWGGLEHGDSRALLGSSSLDRYIVWEPRFNCLLLFKQMQGHCDMQSFLLNNHVAPASGATPPAALESADGNWTLKGPGRPPKKHREMLMRNLKSMEESCWGSGRVASSDFPLVAIWLQEQKMRLDRNRLESAHKDRLVALGALQDHGLNHAPGEGSKSLQTEWLQRLEELRQFKRVTGHCSVPMKFPSNPGLARWVHTQRMRRRMGKMSAGRARQLEKLGFVFEGRSQWEQRFLELVRFKDRVGHCSPCQIGPNRRLGVWVAVQRVKYRKGQLRESRIKKLESIGFSWELHMDWDSRMQQLRVFKAKYGHCNVPQQIKMNGKGRVGTCSLGTWVTMQRMKRRSGRLSERQKEQLENIGFSWGLHAEWESRYEELLKFESQHGHCNVPQKYSQNPSLGAWVAQQRRRYKHGTLSAKRIMLMERVGVEWALRRGRHAHGGWHTAGDGVQSPLHSPRSPGKDVEGESVPLGAATSPEGPRAGDEASRVMLTKMALAHNKPASTGLRGRPSRAMPSMPLGAL